MGLLDFLKPKSDRDRYAQAVIRGLKARGWREAPQYDQQAYTLTFADSTTINLHNGFLAWLRGDAQERANVVAATVGVVIDFEGDLTFAQASPRLLPAIRNRLHLDPMLAGPGEVAFRPFAGPLAMLLIVDSGNGMARVTSEQLAEWEISFEEAMQPALENLRAISPSRFERRPDGFWFSQYGDYHDAARLLTPEVFLQIGVNGHPVAIVMERSAVAVAGSDDALGLEAMAAMVEADLMNLDRPTSYTPLIFREGRWTEFHPAAADHPAIRRLHTRQAFWDYAEQKAALDQTLAERGEDIFVATYAAARGDHVLESFATWAAGVDTLLPRTEYLALQFPSGVSRVRRWSDVARVFDFEAVKTDHYPERFRVTSLAPSLLEAVADGPAPEWAPDEG